jgi:hypothetical protein
LSGRRIDPRRIKIHRSYTIEELARAVGCHKNTARAWTRQGLKAMDDGRIPRLYHGRDARRFLESRRSKQKRKCKPHQLYCFRCREPREPSGLSVDYRRTSALGGILSARCGECSTAMFKRCSEGVALALVPQISLQIIER